MMFTCLNDLDNDDHDDDDDDDDDDDELFLWNGSLTKGIWPYFQTRPLSEILAIANSSTLPAGFEPEPELRLC